MGGHPQAMGTRNTYQLTPAQQQRLVADYQSGTMTIQAIQDKYGFSNAPSVLYRYLRMNGHGPARAPGAGHHKGNGRVVSAEAPMPPPPAPNGHATLLAADESVEPRMWRVVLEMPAETMASALTRLEGVTQHITSVAMIDDTP